MSFLAVYGRVLGLLKPDRYIAVGLVIANFFVVGLQFAEPVLFGRVVNLLARSDTLSRQELVSQAAVLLGIWGIIGGASILANVAVAIQADRLAHRNRLRAMADYFRHVLSLPPAFHRERQSGRLLKMMLSGADSLFGIWLSFFREHLATFLATILLLPLTVILNWQLAIALIILVMVVSAFTVFVISKTEIAQKQVEAYHSTLAGTAQDALSNILVVQSFTRLAAETANFNRTTNLVLEKQFPVLNWWAVLSVVSSAASTITIVTIFVIGTFLHLKGQASIGDIVSFMGFATLLIGRLTGAMGFASRLFIQLPILSDFFAVLDAKTTILEQPGALSLIIKGGEVKFQDVGFEYLQGKPIISDISFTAKPGQVVALVGATGAGKSTTMALLQRYWDPTSGKILIDGQDIRSVTLDSLRNAIGIVFQDSLLFNRSIRENLLVGKPDASEHDIQKACQMAEALDFIVAQPKGFDTLIGERGSNLSGGQRQRLAIARAILKDPPLLILDEATSALDAATEAKVSRALRALMVGRTSFVIAHRLSTIRDADEILVFDEGKIVERGGFGQLLAAGGQFAQLVKTQIMAGAPV